ncbi:acyltransferase family protein [Catellatospora citrea]|uniref:acyltransferase family protein n=1 Tax=Catellatospora citrea TaxID=53366 RepID=UPI00194093E5|nr:acyltransferase [Catellatospora citrea]
MRTETTPPSTVTAQTRPRALWADTAKGACIVLVVLWHVVMKDYLQVDWHIGIPLPGAWGTLGEQLLPLRMPLFFTISGVFATTALARTWRQTARSRIAKFLYLYAAWLLIHTVLLSAVPDFTTARADSALALLEQLTITPSNLWYLYALAAYFVIAKALHRVPRAVVLTAAAALSAITATGVLATPGDRGGLYQNLVFFLAGVYFRPVIERWAETVTNRRLVLSFLAYATALAAMAAAGAQKWPGVWLAVGLVAVAFGVTAAARLSRSPAIGGPLAALGRRTLPIYVIHMPVLALLHLVLHDPISNLGYTGQIIAALCYPAVLSAVVIAICLLIHWVLLGLGASWLFELPRLRGRSGAGLAPTSPIESVKTGPAAVPSASPVTDSGRPETAEVRS